MSSHAGSGSASAGGGGSSIPGDHMSRAGWGAPPGARVAAVSPPDGGGGWRLHGGGPPLAQLSLAYHTYGTLAPGGDNVALVGHSLTSDSAVGEWWAPLLGAGARHLLDTSRYFVVCVNYLGSVYGSSGPTAPAAGAPHGAPPAGADFPVASVRDNVAAQRALLATLGARRVALAVGGSLGGMLALEWAASHPDEVDALVLIATCAAHSAWGVALGAAGRAAVAADGRWRGGRYAPHEQPAAGLAAARQLAMLSYRAPASIDAKFGRREVAAGGGGGGGGARRYDVEQYLDYQGGKFVRRFDALSYVRMTQLLDTHDIGAGRGGGGAAASGAQQEPAYLAVLRALPMRTLVVGIDSDALYPLALAREMAAAIPRASLYTLASPHGHDSFLIEIDKLNRVCCAWRDGRDLEAAAAGGDGTP